jgi:hypothetical protein
MQTCRNPGISRIALKQSKEKKLNHFTSIVHAPSTEILPELLLTPILTTSNCEYAIRKIALEFLRLNKQFLP